MAVEKQCPYAQSIVFQKLAHNVSRLLRKRLDLAIGYRLTLAIVFAILRVMIDSETACSDLLHVGKDWYLTAHSVLATF